MKSIKGGILLLLCLLTVGVPAFAGQFYGGKGFLHTTSGLGLPPGALTISLYGRGYTFKPAGAVATLYDNNSAVAMNFGFTRHMEFGVTQILYQDLNITLRDKSQRDVEAAIPGDAYLRIKFGNYNFKNHFYWALAPGLRVRTSRFHDVYLEPYQGPGMEIETTWSLSYYQKPLFPDEGYSAHLNLGYLNHNDRASFQDAASEFTYLASFVMSKLRYDYGLELYGNAFIIRPNDRVFAREDWMYITPMATYKLYKGLTFTGGVDVLLLGSKETTYRPTLIPDNYPNMPAWRLTGRIAFSPSTPFYVAPTFVDVNDPGTGRERRRSTIAGAGGDDMFSRQQLFRWAIEERFGDQEGVEVDLDRIRQERRHAEEELARLKKELNDQPKK